MVLKVSTGFVGFMVAWFHRSHGFKGFMVSRASWFQKFHGFKSFMVSRFHGFMVSWFRGFVVSRFHRSSVILLFLGEVKIRGRGLCPFIARLSV